ncbi:MAG: 23S rRNA (adenine(2503)-C(2))-methyltransferase RlmN [Bacteroidaceae bacterium]|nr:23S rRNA (adenine(2503)-C(2))-methyltransferase RlmN [Bacteroidaceae bacterium]
MENGERKTPLLGMALDELRNVAARLGLPAYTAGQMARWIYVTRTNDIAQMTNLSQKARQALEADYEVGGCAPVGQQTSVDGTVKYLFPTESGERVESVFIPDGDRATLCVSTQAGCRMGCRFCMTGRQGFQGNLTVRDILNQIFMLPERERLTNIVFMGQGEPMDNIDAVLKATSLLTADYGFAWSPKRITVSTVGVGRGLKRFLDESECHLAISLHNPFPEERQEMMPAEKGYGIAECLDLLRTHEWSHQRRLSFEYIVFAGLNDSQRHARELVRRLGGLHCRVNLIRFHTIPDTPYKRAAEERMTWLRDYLSRHGLTATIRASRGEDIMAACGLLNTAKKNEL